MSRDHERAAVPRDERAAAAWVVEGIHDESDVPGLGELAGDATDLAPDGGIPDVEPAAVTRSHEHDDSRVGLVAERVAEERRGLLALRRRVGEARRLEVVLDIPPDGHGD